ERWGLIMWCAKQRNEIRLNPHGRGRPHDYTKDTAVRVAYARKLERAPQQKKESIVTEPAKQYGLKRRQVSNHKGHGSRVIVARSSPSSRSPSPTMVRLLPGRQPLWRWPLSRPL